MSGMAGTLTSLNMRVNSAIPGRAGIAPMPAIGIPVPVIPAPVIPVLWAVRPISLAA